MEFVKYSILFVVALFSPIEDDEPTSLEFKTAQLSNGKEIEYVIKVPDSFDNEKSYPTLLALPPGAQNQNMVKAGFDLYWNAAKSKGWVVVSPVAPNNKFFNKGSEDLIPELLNVVRNEIKPEGGKFHLAGVSNGGTSAFRVAGKFPNQFHSLTALPGFATSKSDQKNLEKLKDMPIAMFVGDKDSTWISGMESTVNRLKKLGAQVTFEKVKGQGHVIQDWQDGEKLFGLLESWRKQALE